MGEQVTEAQAPASESASTAEPQTQVEQEAPSVTAEAAPVPTPPVATPTDTASVSPVPTHAPGHFGRYSVHEAQDMVKHAHEVIFEHKADKIFAFIQKKGSITHHQTMDLLHVSRPMAYLYLWRLKRAGALVATKKGKEVHYTLPGGTP